MNHRKESKQVINLNNNQNNCKAGTKETSSKPQEQADMPSTCPLDLSLPFAHQEQPPLVSVIMPAFNSANTIRKAVESVFSQSVSLELIIIDDGSTDSLEAALAPFLSYPNIILLKNETNLGVAKSRNRGIFAAQGAYIAFLDADDWWTSDKLERQLTLLEEQKLVLCSTARELVTPTGTLTGKVIPVREEITYSMLLCSNQINCSSVLLRTDAAREFPMEYEDSHEDYIMWLRILRKYKKACAINEPLLKYRLTSTGKSGHKLHSAKVTWKVYRYLGFGIVKSGFYFIQYAVNGVVKYLRA